RLVRRMGLEHPELSDSAEDLLAQLLEGSPGGVSLESLRERGWHKIDLGQGPVPHAEGGFVTPTGKLGLRADWLADAGVDTLPFYDVPAEAAGNGDATPFPLAMVTPKTHLFLNSSFANQKRQ